MNIPTKVRSERRCGFRKPGGLYLVGPKLGEPCGKLVLPLTVCPTCGAGYPYSMSPRWVDAAALFGDRPCLWNCETRPGGTSAYRPGACPLERPADLGRAVLIWVGKEYYPTPGDFTAEARSLGVSRRIKAVPKGFEVGGTWVLLAHLEAWLDADGSRKPGVFSVFRPTEIEYIVKGDESDADLQALIDRGILPIREVDAGDAGTTVEGEDTGDRANARPGASQEATGAVSGGNGEDRLATLEVSGDGGLDG